jgi:DNA-binding transcriptional ArsR family regulator
MREAKLMAEEKKDAEVTFVSQLDTKKPIYKIVGRTPKIETGVDRLLKLVKQKEKITLSEASENLGIPKDTVMSWGEVLEDHGLIDMHYPITGKPSLWKIRPKILKGKKGEKGKKPKSAEPGRGLFGGRSKTKVFFINMEIVVLGLLLVYIFFINRQLSINFVPTLRFHYSGFTSYLMRLPEVLSTGNISIISSNLLLQPLYFALLLIIVIIIILIIVGIVRSRRHKGRIEYKPEKAKKEEKKEQKKEHKKEIKVEKPEKKEQKKEQKKEEKKEKKKEKKDGIFSDIIKDYKERLKEME